MARSWVNLHKPPQGTEYVPYGWDGKILPHAPDRWGWERSHHCLPAIVGTPPGYQAEHGPHLPERTWQAPAGTVKPGDHMRSSPGSIARTVTRVLRHCNCEATARSIDPVTREPLHFPAITILCDPSPYVGGDRCGSGLHTRPEWSVWLTENHII